jgi:hypothetical protein
MPHFLNADKKSPNNVVNIDQIIYCVVFSEEVYVWLRDVYD